MSQQKQRTYLDYAATTPVDPRVVRAMQPFFTKEFGNTMSLHSFGQKAKLALEKSREQVADLIKAKATEIIFTGSATESNNFALKGIAFASLRGRNGFANKNKGAHIIISPIEHPCIIESAKWLKSQGFKISRLRVDKHGLVDPKDVKALIKKDTILVSVMHASNEIGTVEPIKEIGKICKKAKVCFHTDATQTFGKIPINVNEMNVDLLTASAHKMYGPKGVGCLFIREGTNIGPLLHGGGQEFRLRSSTVNVAGIVGFAKAVEICQKEMKKEEKRLTKLRDKLIKELTAKIDATQLNGHPKKRLPNNVNLAFSFIEGESMVIQLDLLGIAASTGSACSSAKLLPSHVLLTIGLKPHQIHGSLRLSLGRWTKEKEIDHIIKVLPKIVKRLREISPYKKFKK